MARLTPQIQKDIVALLRAGTFARVAVEAAGVRWAVYRRWLARGKRGGPKTRFHVFRAEIRQAAAQARARAELEVYTKSPLLWLKHGPGRARRGQPGWTNPVRPAPLQPAGGSTNPLENPAVQALTTYLQDLLAPFPDARLKAAAIMTVPKRTQDSESRPSPSGADPRTADKGNGLG